MASTRKREEKIHGMSKMAPSVQGLSFFNSQLKTASKISGMSFFSNHSNANEDNQSPPVELQLE